MSLSIPVHVNRGIRYALIDGDILVYRCGFAGEDRVVDVFDDDGQLVESFPNKTMAEEWIEYHYWDDEDKFHLGQACIPEPVENVLHSVRLQIDKIVKDVEAYGYTIYLTNPDWTFRESVATIQKYKGNREGMSKPYHYQAIRDYLVDYHQAQVTEYYEADDLLAMEMLKRNDGIICTLDKDLDMIEGLHYNWVDENMYEVSVNDAVRNFYRQLLTGDSVDNIPGLAGVGEVGAEKILGEAVDAVDLYDRVLDAYINQYEDEDEAKAALLENAQLLWMYREDGNGFEAPTA